MKKYAVGFIGYGNMAQAIVSGLVDKLSVCILKDAGFKLKIAVSDPDAEKLARAPKGVAVTSDNTCGFMRRYRACREAADVGRGFERT